MVNVKQRPSRGLGRGLSALISEADDAAQPVNKAQSFEADATKPVEGLLNVPVDSLVANRFQPRMYFDQAKLEELAASIKSNGIMQPIVVRGSAEFAGKFEIIAGERRFRASKLAGLNTVPILLRELDDTQALELAIVENIQRRDLNAIEEAQGYQRLMEEFSYSQEKLSKAVGKSRSHVANLLRLLALPEQIKKYLVEDKISMGHGRALLSAENPEALADDIIRGELSVRQAEKLVRDEKNGAGQVQQSAYGSGEGSTARSQQRPQKAPASAQPKDDETVALEAMLSDNLGLSVEIQSYDGRSGQIVLNYGTLSELDKILQHLDRR